MGNSETTEVGLPTSPEKVEVNECRACGQLIRWVFLPLARNSRIPVDPTPAANGQVIILRDGQRAVMVEPMKTYEPDVHERRFFDHRTMCLGYYATRTVKGSITDPGVDSSGFQAQKERIRAVRRQLEDTRR